jgi:hypothetical protein
MVYDIEAQHRSLSVPGHTDDGMLTFIVNRNMDRCG